MNLAGEEGSGVASEPSDERDDAENVSNLKDGCSADDTVWDAINVLMNPVVLKTVDTQRKQNRTSLLYWKSSCRISAMKMASDRRRYMSLRIPRSSFAESAKKSKAIQRSQSDSTKYLNLQESWQDNVIPEVTIPTQTVPLVPTITTTVAMPVKEREIAPSTSSAQHAQPQTFMPTYSALPPIVTSSSDDGFHFSSLSSSSENRLLHGPDESGTRYPLLVEKPRIKPFEEARMAVFILPPGSPGKGGQLPQMGDTDAGDADVESEVDSILGESSDLDMIMSTPLHELNKKQPQFEIPIQVTPPSEPRPHTSKKRNQKNGIENGLTKEKSAPKVKKKPSWLKRAFHNLLRRRSQKRCEV